MRANRFALLLIAAFGFVGFSTTGNAEEEQKIKPPTNAVVTITVTPPASGPTSSGQVTATASPEVASANWVDIKNYSYDMRAQFFDGLKRLEAKVDGQISELTAKRAAMNSTTDGKEWDLKMKEMVNASSSLKSMGEELSKASIDKWNLQKYKVGKAWAKTQEAYAKIKSSTTP